MGKWTALIVGIFCVSELQGSRIYFGEFYLKKHIWQLILKSQGLVLGNPQQWQCKSEGQGCNVGQVMLDQFIFSCNSQICHYVCKISQGPQNLSCAWFQDFISVFFFLRYGSQPTDCKYEDCNKRQKNNMKRQKTVESLKTILNGQNCKEQNIRYQELTVQT